MVLPLGALTEKGAAHLMQDIALTIRIGDSLPRLPLIFHLKMVHATTSLPVTMAKSDLPQRLAGVRYALGGQCL